MPNSAQVLAKICGLSTPEAVDSAIAGGASFIGFVFFDRSPRNVSPETAARLAQAARARNVKIVALAVDPDDARVDEIAARLKPDFIQLHGKETPARANAVKARTGAGLIKVIPVAETGDLSAARAFDGVADHLMFETKPPKDADRPGGNGVAFDWDILQGFRLCRGPGSWRAGSIPGTWETPSSGRARGWWTFLLAWSAARG